MHMVGLEGIVPQLSGPGGCGMGGGSHQTINKTKKSMSLQRK